MLLPGDPAPWFEARSPLNERFHFDTVAGRYVVLCFLGSSEDTAARGVLNAVERHHERFDVQNACFFGVSIDPADEQRLTQTLPGVGYFWDFDQAISRLYGAAQKNAPYKQHTVVLDPALRVLGSGLIGPDPETHVARVLSLLESLPPVNTLGGFAPVLVAPGVFEPEFCRELIALYEAHGGEESGFVRDVAGQTISVTDHRHKRRSDFQITDETVIRAAQIRLHRRLVPEIKKAFQFHVTRIERHIVACYDAATGGHFRAHRDNTTKGTAHRRFAVTINLNAEEFEGGSLRFPEFGPRAYRAPTGGAIVFSCSLLHEALPVTAGKRYAFLPFLYDDEAARIREENLKYVALGDS